MATVSRSVILRPKGNNILLTVKAGRKVEMRETLPFANESEVQEAMKRGLQWALKQAEGEARTHDGA